jgi:formamidopyrimidine-DNA glycosylase
MPELPEVENVARELRPALCGRRLLSLDCHFPGVLIAGEGIELDAWRPRRVETVHRRGKLLLLDLEGDLGLSVHLRMTGHLSLEDPSTPRRPHTHVTATVDDGRELRFVDPRRFGRVELSTRGDRARTPFLRTLGPEPADLDAGGLAARLAERRGPIKSVLLDQRLVAGLGNIYVDEILHRAGLHPRLEADRLLPAEIVGLVAAMGAVLAEAIESGGSTIRDYRSPDGRAGEFTARHRVFGRSGEPCLACGSTVRKIRLSGRGTHFCPQCQPRRRRRPRRRAARRSRGGTP